MNIINCDNLEIDLTRGYGGLTGSKIAVKYNDAIWMLKCGQILKNHNFKNVELSYANDPISEYIGSHIYAIFDIPVHETILGTYKHKLCVLCKDLAYPYTIVELKTVRNMIMDENIVQSSSGMSVYLKDILETINISKSINREESLQRFWTMFVIDTLIGNADRNNGNWGFLSRNGKLEICPVYDCGGCLNNKRSDKQLANDLETGSIENLALNYTHIFLNENGKRINPFHYIEKFPNSYLRRALQLLQPEHLDDIYELINSINDIISPIRNQWYREILRIRFEKLLQYKSVLKDKIDLVYNSIPKATRYLYGNTPDEIVENYLKEHDNA